MNFPPNEDPALQAAAQSLIDLYSFARSHNRTAVRALVLMAVMDNDTGAVLLAGCDSDECRANAVLLASTISDLPRDHIH